MHMQQFYKALFDPVQSQFGPLDAHTIMPIVGFDAGGPLSFSTIGLKSDQETPTYISCELAVRAEQQPSPDGRFDLLCHSNDEFWVSTVLTALGNMSLDCELGHGHTIDVSEIIGMDSHITGVVLECVSRTIIDSAPYCILRVLGVTAEELDYALSEGSDALVQLLKEHGIYPYTDTEREGIK